MELVQQFLLASWASGFLLFGRGRRALTSKASGDSSLTFIVPARNEETNIAKCVKSIRQQCEDEVIVADDGSTDLTAQIADEAQATVLSVEKAPGWTGKAWACQKAAERAKGTTLFFLDADTYLEMGAATRVKGLIAAHPTTIFSFLPYHQMNFWYEELSAFFQLAMAVGSGWLSYLPNKLVAKRLFGQSLLINREGYLAFGGHEKVRAEILENFFLSSHLQSRNIPMIGYLGEGTIRMRMFPEGYRSLEQGWSKAFARGARGTSPILLMGTIFWMTGAATSFTGLFVGLDYYYYPLFAGQIYWILRRLGSYNLLTGLLFPLPLTYFFVIFFKSIWSTRRGTAIWRGRSVEVA